MSGLSNVLGCEQAHLADAATLHKIGCPDTNPTRGSPRQVLDNQPQDEAIVECPLDCRVAGIGLSVCHPGGEDLLSSVSEPADQAGNAVPRDMIVKQTRKVMSRTQVHSLKNAIAGSDSISHAEDGENSRFFKAEPDRQLRPAAMKYRQQVLVAFKTASHTEPVPPVTARPAAG